MQLTLAILKPDIVQMPLALRHVQNEILRNKFLVVQSRIMQLSKLEAKQFYSEHEQKFFYNRLVTFMSSGPIHAYILLRENAIAEWRKLLGPTKVFKTRYENPDSIRGKFGLSDTRNATHGSDSEETARKEIKFFFPNFDQAKFAQEEGLYFQKGKVDFNTKLFVHRPVCLENSK